MDPPTRSWQARSWQVRCFLRFEVEEPATIALQVAVASAPGRTVSDRLDITLDGRRLATPARRFDSTHGGSIHQIQTNPGVLEATYQATAVGGDRPGDIAAADDRHALAQLLALRPSRYCPSDALTGFAMAEWGYAWSGAERAHAIAAWVAKRITYAPGSTGSLETAVDTLLTGQGVCRDFAHLVISLARALGIPARLVAAYAPGLSPMDFHAVAEVFADGAWQIFDATRLAPRTSLLRIATGRDAADVAFADVVHGLATMTSLEVHATTDVPILFDDETELVRLP